MRMGHGIGQRRVRPEPITATPIGMKAILFTRYGRPEALRYFGEGHHKGKVAIAIAD